MPFLRASPSLSRPVLQALLFAAFFLSVAQPGQSQAVDGPARLLGAPVDRFVEVPPEAHPEAMAVATAQLASVLASAPGTELFASLAVLGDGKRLVIADHVGSTDLYGIGAAGTYIFAADPGGAFRQVYATNGVRVWLDTLQVVQGWPDLWVQSYRGINPPFGVWRFNGVAYQHSHNAGGN